MAATKVSSKAKAATKEARAKTKAKAAPAAPPPAKKIRIAPVVTRCAVDLQSSLSALQCAVDAIFRRSNANGLSFEELYRHAYNLIKAGHSAKLYQMVRDKLVEHLAAYRDAVFAAGDTGSSFEVLDRKWIEFTRAQETVRALLSYLERTYVVQYRETSIYDLGLQLWKSEVVSSPTLRQALTGYLMDQVEKERSGEMIDRGKMRRSVEMLIQLDYAIYVLLVEEPFLAGSRDFYAIESQELLSVGDCSAILKRVEKRLKEESGRVVRYLSEKTGPKINRLVMDVFVVKNIKQLVEMENTGLDFMLAQDRREDLARMHELFQHEDEGIKAIRDGLLNHVRETGEQLVQDTERQKDSVGFIQMLLDLKKKFDAIVSSSFKKHKILVGALESAFEAVVNKNRRLPEFLSLFLDTKLRQGGKSDTGTEDTEAVIDGVMLIFRYINEKDMFEKYYKHHLAKRLLLSKTAEDELERGLILKIRTVCGYQFTSKIENMLTDVKTSEELMQRFRKMLANVQASAVNVSVQVLTTGSWPAYPSSGCILPVEVQGPCETFKTFYLQEHRGRRLSWQGNLGSADLKVMIGETSKMLSCSTYQMCILMLFNDSDRLGYKEIQDATGIQSAMELKRNLQSLALVKGKNVLRKEPMSKDINEGDVFVFNDGFTSKMAKIKICTVAAQKESGEESSRTREKIESDRNPQIEAAIVRVMKARQKMEHNNLVSEVIAQLQSRFNPNPAAIKKRIEALIDRDYLERDRDERRTYRYLA